MNAGIPQQNQPPPTASAEARWFAAIEALVSAVCSLAAHEIPERLEDAAMWRDELREAAEQVRLIAMERGVDRRVPDHRSLDAALVLEAVGSIAWWLFITPQSGRDLGAWCTVLVQRVEKLASVLGAGMNHEP